ncbi:MAG: diaminopimelate epimerase [bacterium]
MRKQLPFAKFSATGNDFILFDNREHDLKGDEIAFFQRICARRTGVGADGILLIEDSGGTDYRLRYFNADGYETEMCGNGARAAAFYAFHNGLAPIHCKFEINDNMYEAIVEGKAVSLLMHAPTNMNLEPGVLLDEGLEEGGIAEIGVPHYVLFAKDVSGVDVDRLGKKYCEHEFFQPRRTNVNFVSTNPLGEMEIRTYERGVDTETLSCGTGTVVSAFIASERLGKMFPMAFKTRGGTLTVSIDEKAGRPLLHGEVQMPFMGDVFYE